MKLFIIPSCLQNFLGTLVHTVSVSLSYPCENKPNTAGTKHNQWHLPHSTVYFVWKIQPPLTQFWIPLYLHSKYDSPEDFSQYLQLCAKTWICRQLLPGFRPVNGADLNWTWGPFWESGTWLSRCWCFWMQDPEFDTKCHGPCDTGCRFYNFLLPVKGTEKNPDNTVVCAWYMQNRK